MRRSVGVTVIAVLSLAGSVLTLLLGILMVAVAVIAPAPSQAEFPFPPLLLKALLLLVSLMYLGVAAWGIATGIGLLRLRNWARLSIIVFSVLLIIMSAFSALMLVSAPAFPNLNEANPSVMTAMRVAMGVFWLGQLGVGIWWLVFFNRAKVKQQFLSSLSPLPPPAPEIFADHSSQVSAGRPQRPLSLTILAWFLLVGCLFLPLSLAMRAPAILFTKMVTGLPAGLYYFVMLALQLYIGIGLLRVKPFARTVGVGYYVFLFINTAVFYLAPGRWARIHQLFDWQFTIFPWMRAWQNQNQWQTQFDPIPSFIVGSCMGLACLAVPLYFLITRKRAFEKAAASRTAI
ncbi:MAG: hypothetical protein ACLQBK_09210 [Candidatus Sulfotelmatobacter sp.]